MIHPSSSHRRHKVLVLSRNYPNNVLGGLGIWVKHLVHHCTELCDIKVISPVPYCPPVLGSSYFGRFRRIHYKNDENGVQVFYPRFIVGPGCSLYVTEALSYYLGIRRQVDQIWKDFRFDIIHAHFTYPDGVAGVLLAKRYNVPIVITEHAPWAPNWMDKSFPIRRQSVWAAGNSVFHIAVSQSVLKTIARFTGSTERIRIIPIGVDESIFTPSLNGNTFNSKQVLYVGFINFNKGIDVLLKAMRRLLQKRPDSRLVLVGGSFYRNTRLQEEKIHALVDELGIRDNVVFVGRKTPEEVTQYMRESALLVLPSRAESFGAVLVEALACGTPVVATNCGGPEDIVTDGVGILVPTENSDALCSAIDAILTNRNDFESGRLREYALSRFSWKTVAAQTVELYREALEGRSDHAV